jgi:ammonium transporter, Amt family
MYRRRARAGSLGGVWGTLAVGPLGAPSASARVAGVFYGGGAGQLGRQAIAVVVVAAWSFLISMAIGRLLQRTIGFRIAPEDEMTGIDSVVHAETAYELDALGGGHPVVPRRPATVEPRPWAAPLDHRRERVQDRAGRPAVVDPARDPRAGS